MAGRIRIVVGFVWVILLCVVQVITKEQVHIPPHLPTDEQFLMVHTPEYLSAFSSGMLEASLVRRCVLHFSMETPSYSGTTALLYPTRV